MQCKELNWVKFKGDFLNILIGLHPQITDIFQVAVSRINISTVYIYIIYINLYIYIYINIYKCI